MRCLGLKAQAHKCPLNPSKINSNFKDMEFITKYSESVKIGTKETINGPSMTEPDNAMSIPEIIARFTRGQGLAVPVRPWEAGSASEDGQPMADQDINEFMNGPQAAASAAPTQEPAPAAPAAAPPAPQAPDSAPAPQVSTEPTPTHAPAQ